VGSIGGRRRLAVRHGMSDGVKTVRVLLGTGVMPARGACEPQGKVKVGRRRKGSWETCEWVEDIRGDVCAPWLTGVIMDTVMVWRGQRAIAGKALMDDIEGILVVVSWYVDGG
jgi:hypothetical protein